MADIYTHNFKFQIGDGGQFVEGDIEFNSDGRVSYRIDESSDPLLKETLVYFNRLIDLLKDIYHGNDPAGIKLIKFNKKK